MSLRAEIQERRVLLETPIVTPKFVTAFLAEQVVKHVLRGFRPDAELHLAIPGLETCHIVVLVPAMKDDRASDYADWPNYQLQPHCIYEHSEGDKATWSHKFDDIARCKALQLWHDRNDDRTDCMPHLLFPGDTPYWGGVKRHGIVVTCSGVDPWFDKMISGMIADMIIGFAYRSLMSGEDKKEDRSFLK